MTRKHLAEILEEADISPLLEYQRLYHLFYRHSWKIPRSNKSMTLKDICEAEFKNMPFRGTCLSLKDFDNTHSIFFNWDPDDFDIDYLILFCEYTYNFLFNIQNKAKNYCYPQQNYIREYIEQLSKVLEIIHYSIIKKDVLFLIVMKSQEAVATAEISDSRLSYNILEYNHHSLKGDLARKLSILKQLADDIEPRRKDLQSINSSMADVLFQLLQKFVRHNNSDNIVIANMSNEELESVYDDIYQMWLLSKLELDNVERKRRAKELLGRINS